MELDCLTQMVDNPININQISEFIQEHGEEHCYLGITNNILERFGAHKLVDSEGRGLDSRIVWYWGDAETEDNARAIEKEYHNKFKKLQGNPGGGKNPTKVYVYRIISGITVERSD